MRTAVVLFNLGGPDSLEAVQPFLFNLFNDKAIIGLPQPFRFLLAKLISGKRAPESAKLYALMGGKSPLLEISGQQAEALQAELGKEYRCFVCMRYWQPQTREVVESVKAYAPEKIILLPFYPQFSTTTTGSSVKLWHEEAKKHGLNVPTELVGCYPTHPDFIRAHVEAIRQQYDTLQNQMAARPRALFSAHGLPEKVVAAGDPYQYQVEQTVAAVVEQLGIPDLDYVTCYQSRVGPLQWIGPATDAEIRRAGEEGKAVLVVPIAFVSEHIETLVELDVEYRHLAEGSGVPYYARVPALNVSPAYIASLASLCREPKENGFACPERFSQCICRKQKAA